MCPSKSYEGTCNACGKESKYLERDHRVPPRLGGGRTQWNLQDLCLECHKRKSFLETTLMDFYGTTEVVREWMTLAFQNDYIRMKGFADEMHLRAGHFSEVIEKMKNGQ